MMTDSTGTETLTDVSISIHFSGGDDFRRRGADTVHVGARHCRVQRQRHRLTGDALAVWKLPFVATERSSKRAQMKRFIRHAGADAPCFESVTELLAVDRQTIEWQEHAEHVPRIVFIIKRNRFRRHGKGPIA